MAKWNMSESLVGNGNFSNLLRWETVVKNKLLRHGIVAVYLGSGLGVSAMADPVVPMDNKDPGIQAGPVKVTLGGFIEAAGIYRSRNETADVGSSFTAIPFANNNNYYTSEFRESARQSRLQLLMQGPTDGVNKVEAFYAMDFLSAGVTSNSNESNSYTMRERELYADWVRSDYDLYVLGGQTWSLATMYKQGLTPRKENVPLTIDAQYAVGFNWARQAQFRVVKNFGKTMALGLSLEEPQNLLKGTAPAGALGGNTGGSLLNNGSTGTANSSSASVSSIATYSTDVAPDVIVKAAFDPGFGHYEIYSLTRFFHDRAEATPGTVSSTQNNTSIAESIGAGALVPVLPKMLDFQVSGLIGHGNGRYGSSQLADSTYNKNDGSPAALEEQQILVGFVGHPTSALDAYLYAGMEHGGTAYGYGISDNSACNVNLADSPTGKCSGTIATARQVAAGFWWNFYKGTLGHLALGMQGSFTKLSTFTDAADNRGRTNDSMGFVSFRYYPFQ
jgi:hypothetical protein